jgi:hypothetical protein
MSSNVISSPRPTISIYTRQIFARYITTSCGPTATLQRRTLFRISCCSEFMSGQDMTPEFCDLLGDLRLSTAVSPLRIVAVWLWPQSGRCAAVRRPA